MTLRTAVALGHRRLYHYQNFNANYLREVIIDGVIHFSKPSDFNDPWDCRPWYLEISKKHRPYITSEHLTQTADAFRTDPNFLAAKIREFSEVMAKAIDAQYRVYCLSSKVDCE